MPYRVTLINNAKQSTRTTFLLPEPTSPSAILVGAQNKLRLRKPSRIFLACGEEITNSPGEHLHNGVELLISCGEEFVGTHKPLITASSCQVRVIAQDTYIDPQARQQLEAVGFLPGMTKVVGMPDLHPGTKSPVGAAFVSEGVVYPALIGGDIGCGMGVYRTSLTGDKVSDSEVKKLAERLVGMEGPWEGDVPAWLLGGYLSSEEVEEVMQWAGSLGTIGAGNHFAELQQITSVIPDLDEDCPVYKDQVVLVVHSGSRGLGQSILSQSAESYPSPSEACTEYLRKHRIACSWAKANRDLIALRFLSCLSKQQDLSHQSVRSLKILDIWHNNVELHQGQYIHRKGAAPATAGTVIIPGSRGTLSAYVRPTPTEETAWSLAHGAGRAQSRAAVFKKLSKRYRPGELERTKLGGWVVCEDKELIYEEAPEGYKDVESVVRDLVEVGACEVIAWGMPRVSYKVRK